MNVPPQITKTYSDVVLYTRLFVLYGFLLFESNINDAVNGGDSFSLKISLLFKSFHIRVVPCSLGD
jgi:hypothetical protein